ncbi:DHA2 family efflux MFS transporter permease subunit [Methylomonas paludis]|uniref:DHA2 family efflux MFS transporter permease subunit n=1 Tax=Methylomonas paludis TaxID=1173101 RepID=A0A975ML91_9GAMM|nr:DHA2 family efflux MFS transporter permease subunit [Methylomonas paludis]QWF69880.1 DHA2 family efflux MFS transporter permease subunit [Methylomonas paludis]
MNAAAPAVNPYLIAVVVSLAAFMEVLDTTIVNVALAHIGGSLAASPDESTWVLTSYLVANGIVLPLSGWLAGVMGRKNYFLLSIVGFTLTSFACGLATSLPMLIVFRLLQGLAGGGLQPMQMAIVMDAFPLEKRGTAFGITGLTMIVAPILGPTLGGFITDSFNWRWIFFMNVPIGLLALILVKRLVQDPVHAQAKGLLSIDYIGLGLVVLGLGALQVVLDKGQEDDWFSSHFIIFFSIVCVVSLLAAVVWLLRQPDPVIDLRLMQNRSFGMASLMIFFVGIALYSSSTLLPLLVQTEFGYDATTAGLVLSPGGLALVILMPVVGKLVNRFQASYLIALGMLLVSGGMWLTSFITPQSDYEHFVLMRVFQVLGLPFLFIPSSTLAFSGIPPEKSSKASALFSLIRNLGGSIGISLVLSYVARHQQLHQTVLVEHLNAANPGYVELLAQYTRHAAGSGVEAGRQALNRIYQQLLSQSSILAYCDAFRLLAVITLGLAGIALLMPKHRSGPTASPIAGH